MAPWNHLAHGRTGAMLKAAMKRPSVITCRMTLPNIGGSGHLCDGPSRRSFTAGVGFGTFKRVLGHLRVHLPAAQPVVVRTSWLADETLGECVRRPKKFVIRLNDELTEHLAIEVLCHEWAHALAWNYAIESLAKQPEVTPEQFEAEAHGEAWGCAYSRVWRTYIALG